MSTTAFPEASSRSLSYFAPDEAQPSHLRTGLCSPNEWISGGVVIDFVVTPEQPAKPSFAFSSFRLYPRQRPPLENDKPIRLGSRALGILLVLIECLGSVTRASGAEPRRDHNIVVTNTSELDDYRPTFATRSHE
jgi:hypothetical protein